MRQATALPHTSIPVGHLWNGSTGNYDRNSLKKDLIVIHTMQGTTQGSSAHFKNINNQASANYGVSLNGDLTLWIPEDCVAYASGNWEINRRSISIEHEDGYHPTLRPQAFNQPRPDELYESSARLVADLSSHYGIPLDRQHIIKHNEVINPKTGQRINKACPGTLDIDRIINRAKEIISGSTGEEQLVAHMLKPSVFSALVTKSTNWDEYCERAGISREIRATHHMGEQAWALHEKQLTEAKNSMIPQNIPNGGIPVGVATDQQPIIPTPEVPSNPTNINIPRKQAKSLWEKDVLEALRDIGRKLSGRVTI